MYLVDTNVISEGRKGRKANPGVKRFFKHAAAAGTPLFISVIIVGEIRRGIELLTPPWRREQVLEFGREAQIWGRLCDRRHRTDVRPYRGHA